MRLAFDDYMHDDVTQLEKAQIKFETDLIGKIVLPKLDWIILTLKSR